MLVVVVVVVVVTAPDEGARRVRQISIGNKCLRGSVCVCVFVPVPVCRCVCTANYIACTDQTHSRKSARLAGAAGAVAAAAARNYHRYKPGCRQRTNAGAAHTDILAHGSPERTHGRTCADARTVAHVTVSSSSSSVWVYVCSIIAER